MRKPPKNSPFKGMENFEDMMKRSQSAFNPYLSVPNSRYVNKTSDDEINFHFNRLFNLARTHAPHIMNKLNFLHRVVLDHNHKKISPEDALEKIRSVIEREGLNPHIYHSAKSSLDMRHNRIPMSNPLNQFPKMNFTPMRIQPLRLRKNRKKPNIPIVRLPRLRVRF
jgi:hypothetical protein